MISHFFIRKPVCATPNLSSNLSLRSIFSTRAHLLALASSLILSCTIGLVQAQPRNQTPVRVAAHHLFGNPQYYGVLRMNEVLYSPQGRFALLMQPNGNFGVYRGECVGQAKCLLYGTNLELPLEDYFLSMQGDGNLVIYRGIPGRTQTPVWASNSGQGSMSHYTLAMQDDSNLVIYRGNNPADMTNPIWSAQTGPISAQTPTAPANKAAPPQQSRMANPGQAPTQLVAPAAPGTIFESAPAQGQPAPTATPGNPRKAPRP